MKKLYKIKEDHPIKEFIRQEIINNSINEKINNSKNKNDFVGISVSYIEEGTYSSYELYGFRFNRYNTEVACINVGVWFDPKPGEVPKILNSETMDCRTFYNRSYSTTIKLKTFLERNPQWKNIDEWADEIEEDIEKREKCKYDGHDSDERLVSIRRPDGKDYRVDFPEDVESDGFVLDWVKPMEEALTKYYYDQIDSDKRHNIKRQICIWISYLEFYFDYNDGVVEIYNIYDTFAPNLFSSLYDHLLGSKILSLENNLPKETLELIKKQVEDLDLEVKDIKLVEKRNYGDQYIGNFDDFMANIRKDKIKKIVADEY